MRLNTGCEEIGMNDKCYSKDGEIFGDVDLEDVEGECEYYSGDLKKINPSELVSKWVADEILERMDERLYEECGDSSEDSLKMDNDAKEKLNAIIAEFMDNHCSISCYKVINVEYHPLPPDGEIAQTISDEE
jgi:hypothetical protein